MEINLQAHTFTGNLNRIKPKTIFITGFIAGTLDGLAAAIMYYVQAGKDPLNVYRFIASGVLGMEAFNGGVPVAILGIVFHYIIAFGWTILFFVIARRVDILLKNWFVSGVLYGIFVWLLMNLVVVPLSLVPMKPGPREWPEILKGATILILCIGLPIAFSASKNLKQSN